MRKYILMLIIVTSVLSALAQTDTLHVYGPGGPLSAMQNCAKVFTAKTGIPVIVTGGGRNLNGWRKPSKMPM